MYEGRSWFPWNSGSVFKIKILFCVFCLAMKIRLAVKLNKHVAEEVVEIKARR